MASDSPAKAEDVERGSPSGTPTMSDVELESALLRSVVHSRPVGNHKHVLMIQLQGELHRRTGLWMPVSDLWDKLGDMFNIPALDSMSSPPSMPDSPRELSPLPAHRGRARLNAGSTSKRGSPDSESSQTPEPASIEPSKSADLINSSYFGAPFTLPYFRLGQDQWKSNLYTSDPRNDRRRSKSAASTSTRAETEKGFMIGEEEPDMSDSEEIDWKYKIYDEDDRASKGVDHEAEDEAWEKGVEQQLTSVDVDEGKKNGKDNKSKAKTNAAKKRARPSQKRQERDDTSELSDDADQAEEEEEDQDEEQEAEEEATKVGRGKRVTAGKRKRDSTTKEESEDEKETKETKPRRKRK